MALGFGLKILDNVYRNLSMRINSHGLLSVWYRRAKSECFNKDITRANEYTMKILDVISEGEELMSSEALNIIGGDKKPNNVNDALLSCKCEGNGDNINDSLLTCSCSDDE